MCIWRVRKWNAQGNRRTKFLEVCFKRNKCWRFWNVMIYCPASAAALIPSPIDSWHITWYFFSFRLVGSNKFSIINMCRFFTISMLILYYFSSFLLAVNWFLDSRCSYSASIERLIFNNKLMSIFNLHTFVSQFQHVICKFVKIENCLCKIDFFQSNCDSRDSKKNWAQPIALFFFMSVCRKSLNSLWFY